VVRHGGEFRKRSRGEEGFVQNSGAISGLTVKFGRMLSGFGYLNEIHAHAWDFVDAPLVYQAFFGASSRRTHPGALAGADPVLVEVGVETGRGSAFPDRIATRTASTPPCCSRMSAMTWASATAIASGLLPYTKAQDRT
jgi:hypothetical protein